MIENNLTQKAGNYSNQYQIENINIGLTEEQVRNIIKEENILLLKETIIVANEIAQKRLDNYTDVLVPKLVKSELLSAFCDPTIQILYKTSEKIAICTERKADYEMLSELLIHKIEKKNDYITSTAIEKAINEVNNISDEALMTLTLIFSIITYVPNSGNISQGLSALDILYKHFLELFCLPDTKEWLENLELINAIKTNNIMGSKRLEEYFYDTFDGYACLGIKKDSEKHKEVIKKFVDSGLPTNILVKNELDENYLRLNILTKNNIEDLELTLIKEDGNKIEVELTQEQKEVLKETFDNYEAKNPELKKKFNNFLDTYDSIKIVKDWWNKTVTNYSINLTAIGRVLACTNAVRIDNSLPNIIKNDK